MNKVTLIGRLTRDPEIRRTQGENSMTVARYTLAVDRRYKRDEGQQADFISCVAFGKTGEFAEKYLHKGMKIAVNGRIQTGSYTKQDGQKVYTTDVVIEDHEFVEGRNASAGQSSGGASYSNNNYNNNTAPQPAAAAGDGFMNIPDGIDEELPFN